MGSVCMTLFSFVCHILYLKIFFKYHVKPKEICRLRSFRAECSCLFVCFLISCKAAVKSVPFEPADSVPNVAKL